jgi:uncharacterized protein CbrC (UPF0167 family)
MKGIAPNPENDVVLRHHHDQATSHINDYLIPFQDTAYFRGYEVANTHIEELLNELEELAQSWQENNWGLPADELRELISKTITK